MTAATLTRDQQTPEPGDDANLARVGARGAVWQGAAFVVGKGVVLLTTVVLARLLAPEQFGLVSLALVFITYAEALADVGVAQALVYLPGTRGQLRAALLASLVTGVLLLSAGVGGATAIASVFHRSDVIPLVRLLSFTLLATALSAVPEAVLRRALRFNRLTVATIVRALVTGVVSIGLAVAGMGAWALGWGTVAGAVAYALVTWALSPVRPDLWLWRTTRSDLRDVLGYGLPVAAGTLLAKLIFDVDYLIVGHSLGAEALGFYTLAFRMPEFLIINVFFVISSVTFPLYTRARDDRERLARGYLTSLSMQSVYGVCAGVGLAVVAPLLVPLVFGAAWRPVIAPLIALSLYASLRSLGAGANDLYKAMGRPVLAVVVSLVRLAILVPVLVFATRWGVTGVAWAQAICSLVFVLFMQGVASRVIQVRAGRMIGAAMPALSAGGAIIICAGLLVSMPIASLPALAIAIAGGAVTALVVFVFGFPSMTDEVQGLLLRRSGKTGTPRRPQHAKWAPRKGSERADIS